MSLTRYENEQVIIQLNEPQYGQVFRSVDLNILPHTYLVPDDPNFVKSNITQLHIYSFYGDYIAGDHNASYLVHDKGTNSFLIDLAETFREANIRRGSYIVVANSLAQVWGNPDRSVVYISEISPDRTELKLTVPSGIVATGEVGTFRDTVGQLSAQNILNNLVIDFGFNRIEKILMVRFDPNDASVIYLKLYKPLNDEVDNKQTAWFGLETMNSYVDTVILTSPIAQGQTHQMRGANYDIDSSAWASNATVFKSWNDLLDTDAPTTQRIIDASLSGSGQVHLNIDYTDFSNFIFYSSAEERVKNFKYKLGLIQTYGSNIDTLETTLVSSSIGELIVSGGFDTGGSGWKYSGATSFAVGTAQVFHDPAGGTSATGYVSQSITTTPEETYWVHFDGTFAFTTFAVPMTIAVSVNNVVKYTKTTSTSQTVFASASFTGSGTDIVKFTMTVNGSGQPVMRGGNVILDNISVPYTITHTFSGSRAVFTSASIATNQNRINTLLSTFDSFERWLYYTGTSSLFTHDISGSITPYPKYILDGRYVVHHTTSSIATAWYNGMISSASVYDHQNVNRLWWSIPEHVVMDEGNSDYVLFVDMVGQHFDNLYSYTKALTQIHERDEHPERGTSNDLLYHVAKSFGWNLQNTRQLSDLWFYKAGMNSTGQYDSTGSMFSLSRENQTQQIWRRVVNNLPYLLKTKGTARSVKAMMSIYGIPQTIISIKEYGGPSAEADKPQLIDDHFGYALNFAGSQSVVIPRVANTSFSSSTYNGVVPDTVMFRFNTTYTGSGAMTLYDIDYINVADGNNHYKGLDLRIVPATASISGSHDYGQLYLRTWNHTTNLTSTVSTPWMPLFDGDMWNVWLFSPRPIVGNSGTSQISVVVARAADCTNGTYVLSGSARISGVIPSRIPWWYANRSLTNQVKSRIGGAPVFSFGITGSIANFSGSIHGYKEYITTISSQSFIEHVLNPLAYHVNNPTSSYDYLYKYFPLGLDAIRYDHSASMFISSSQPNRGIYGSGSFNSVATFSNFGFIGDQDAQYRDFRETHYVYTPSIGGNNIRNSKIRLEGNSLRNTLSPTIRSERSQYDYAPIDTNRLAVVFSLADHVNRDIFNQFGFDELDEWIADPQLEFENEYSELKRFSNHYYKKYTQRNDINAFIRILSVYDYTFFEQIKQLVPGRADLIAGILIEPNILERSKVQVSKRPTIENPQWDRVITIRDKDPESEYLTFEGSASAAMDVDFQYHYLSGSIPDPVFFDIGYTYHTGSIFDPVEFDGISIHHVDIIHQNTGICGVVDVYPTRYSGSQSHTQSIVDDPRIQHQCKYFCVEYHYSGSGVFETRYKKQWYAAVSKSYGMYYSRSLHPCGYQIDECGSRNNSRYRGSKMTGADFNVDSPDTVDGGPVVTIIESNPNNLFMGGSGDRGNLLVE